MQLTGNALFLVAAVLLLQNFEVVQSLTCYNCTSQSHTNCGESFVATGIPTCTGSTCSKGFASYSGYVGIYRSCESSYTETSCTDATAGGISGKACYCNSDNCNSQNVFLPNNFFILLSAFIATCVGVLSA